MHHDCYIDMLHNEWLITTLRNDWYAPDKDVPRTPKKWQSTERNNANRVGVKTWYASRKLNMPQSNKEWTEVEHEIS